ncbi:hypothetical protein Rhe02_01820 [Rhizocola hellebori]|uniref:Uncharacterized protein n=1 Tax=Rhizocola hellebori TaxID=1392758 RepID=A0A8J3Q1N1_9ACTN|nr:S-4TM family putative pore-forming effector [Rhizocola hellebori]GIH02115.1 hypothetical protein Rhe02_01820 [Rhizocola hellebori]
MPTEEGRASKAESDLREQQNSPESLLLLRAITASHLRAQRLEGLRLSTSALIAVLGLVTTTVTSIATAVTVIGGLWALLHAVGLSAWAQREVQRAALLQEMFDVALFRLPWNLVVAGPRVNPDEISKLARLYRGSEDLLRGYYEIPELPGPYDVLACQQQNLGWGARIRQRYSFAILIVVATWAAAGVMLGSLLEITVADIVLQFYVPSLGALMMGLDTYRAQQLTAKTRSQALIVVREQIVAALGRPDSEPELSRLAREVQNVIFQTRVTCTRVPNIFFDRYRDRDRVDFQASMQELSRMVNAH